jgi:hypothetical protein
VKELKIELVLQELKSRVLTLESQDRDLQELKSKLLMLESQNRELTEINNKLKLEHGLLMKQSQLQSEILMEKFEQRFLDSDRFKLFAKETKCEDLLLLPECSRAQLLSTPVKRVPTRSQKFKQTLRKRQPET